MFGIGRGLDGESRVSNHANYFPRKVLGWLIKKGLGSIISTSA